VFQPYFFFSSGPMLGVPANIASQLRTITKTFS
jgi:hypothetical protein